MDSILSYLPKSWVAALPFDFPHLKTKSPLLLRLALISFCDLQTRVLSSKDSFQSLRHSFFCRNKLHFETFKATGMIRRASLVAQWLEKKIHLQCRRPGFDPWRRKRQPTPEFLPGKFHGQRSLVDYSPWGHKESDTTEAVSMIRNTDSLERQAEHVRSLSRS